MPFAPLRRTTTLSRRQLAMSSSSVTMTATSLILETERPATLSLHLSERGIGRSGQRRRGATRRNMARAVAPPVGFRGREAGFSSVRRSDSCNFQAARGSRLSPPASAPIDRHRDLKTPVAASSSCRHGADVLSAGRSAPPRFGPRTAPPAH
jgi:hypothetical protein